MASESTSVLNEKDRKKIKPKSRLGKKGVLEIRDIGRYKALADCPMGRIIAEYDL